MQGFMPRRVFALSHAEASRSAEAKNSKLCPEHSLHLTPAWAWRMPASRLRRLCKAIFAFWSCFLGPVHLNRSSCFEVPKDGRWGPHPASSAASWAQTILQRRATDILTDKTAAPASILPPIPEYGILDRYRQKIVHASLRIVAQLIVGLIGFQLDARLCTSLHTRAPTGFRTGSSAQTEWSLERAPQSRHRSIPLRKASQPSPPSAPVHQEPTKTGPFRRSVGLSLRLWVVVLLLPHTLPTQTS